MRNYRTTVILNTQGYEDPVENLVNKVSDLLKELGAEVANVDNIGYQAFVSGPVKKHAGDIFVVYEFSGGPDLPAQLEEKTRLDKTIKRLQVHRI
jgi:small subunit ribosomal protein S6